MLLWDTKIKKNKLKKYSTNFTYRTSLSQKFVTSGASRKAFFLKNKLPYGPKHKKLTFVAKSYSGRSSTGQITVRTKKKSIFRKKLILINYKYRLTSISFISNFILTPKPLKVLSLVVNSNGSFAITQASTVHELFKYAVFISLFLRKRLKNLLRGSVFNAGLRNQPFIQIFFLIVQLPKNLPVCLLELTPLSGVKYVRSAGSTSQILRRDTRLGTALVRLPSKVKKVFSIFSSASLGYVSLLEKKKCLNNSAGHQARLGNKPLSRGVAMNPVDHPHGGRAKPIKHKVT